MLAPRGANIFRARTEATDGTEITFHRHQTDAFEIANRRESYVLTTGTGSGKSMAYIVPIVDRVLREGSGKGVRAIVVYPMNALANSQLNELEKFLGKTNPKVTLRALHRPGEQGGTREDPRRLRPDILLTNYVMLELMLTRPKERKSLISSAENLSFLVLDELHTYRGRQGADVAMLVRRLRGAVGVDMTSSASVPAPPSPVPGTKAEQRSRSPSWRPGSSASRSRSQHRRGNPTTCDDGRGRPGHADGTAGSTDAGRVGRTRGRPTGRLDRAALRSAHRR